jgi:hypothetical protein
MPAIQSAARAIVITITPALRRCHRQDDLTGAGAAPFSSVSVRIQTLLSWNAAPP